MARKSETALVSIKQDPDKPVATEVLAESIRAIAQAAKILVDGPLTDEALLLLIQNNTPWVRGNRVPTSTIKVVIEAIEGLERKYVKKRA